ncbi:MAG: HK97 family phage prohead protease [Actinomycetaceae bacterium]|nr:HK97 family phage prohead protease [Actinomycetaceae bacterium]
MKTKLIELGVKADEGDLGQFTAYASTFTRTPDSYGDVVAPGAFKDSLEEWKASGNVIPVLWGHDFADPYKNIGSVLDAGEDDHGLKVRGQLDLDNPLAKQVYRLIKARRVTQMSFAFDVIDSAFIQEDGEEKFELRKLKLYEVSIVPVGANQDTEILEVKAAEDAPVEEKAEEEGEEEEELPADLVEVLESAINALASVLDSVRRDDNENQGSGDGNATSTDTAEKSRDLGAKARLDALSLDLALLELEER